MKILFVAPEVAPFVKVGGLADVVGALPKALEALGHDVRVVCPLYGSIQKDGAWRPHGKPLSVPMGHGMRYARLWETSLPASSVPSYFVEYDEFFARPEVYEGPWGWHGDNDRRFGFFCRAALEVPFWLDWMPDVIHVHDWAAGLIPPMLNTVYAGTPLGRAATVLTIHNLQHQGYCDRSLIDFTGLPQWLYRPEHLESMGAVSMLKGAIYHSTKITTVSPTYAHEIQTPEGGQGMHDILRFRSADLVGVLNGIDTGVWSPLGDPHLPAWYSHEDLSGKEDCKRALCGRFGLDYSGRSPIFGVVSRLYDQKGLDLLEAIVPRLIENLDLQVVVLGTGDQNLERSFCDYQARYPGKFAAWIGFDDARAHQIYAGADYFVMPSRFEPCGLGQLYSMVYGTPPIVRLTGGLVDTVEPYEKATGTGTGFTLEDATPHALYEAMAAACSLWHDHPDAYRELQVRGMRQDFSWEKSAASYSRVYQWAVEQRTGIPITEPSANGSNGHGKRTVGMPLPL